jgi:hypothetical protein
MKHSPLQMPRHRQTTLLLTGVAAALLLGCSGNDYSSYRSDDMYESIGGYHYSGSVYDSWGYGGYYGGYYGGGGAVIIAPGRPVARPY